MKTLKNSISVMLVLFMITGATTFEQNTKIAEANVKDYSVKHQAKKKNAKLDTYVIERDMAGAGDMTSAQLVDVSKLSNTVLKEQGSDIAWLHSYVTGDKIYCVYKATDKEILRVHADKAGFPITSINKLVVVISPKTATASVN